MSLLVFVMLGVVVGFVARALVPGLQSMHVLRVTALSVGGALTGGVISTSFTDTGWSEVNATATTFAVVGGIVTLLMVVAQRRGARRARP